jgi:hypothetical protein
VRLFSESTCRSIREISASSSTSRMCPAELGEADGTDGMLQSLESAETASFSSDNARMSSLQMFSFVTGGSCLGTGGSSLRFSHLPGASDGALSKFEGTSPIWTRKKIVAYCRGPRCVPSYQRLAMLGGPRLQRSVARKTCSRNDTAPDDAGPSDAGPGADFNGAMF